MDKVLRFIDDQRARFVSELTDWVKIPAISADPAHKADMVKNAEYLAAELRRLEADRVEVWPTAGHPAVFASFMHAPGKPTLLVYGHHDVQPVDPLEEWISPPFEPAIREGRMWGRGVVDDKGQVWIHVKAIEAFLAGFGGGAPDGSQKLPINLKLIVEGEEEIGSNNLDTLMREHDKDLVADFVCVSDTAMFGRGIPSLCVGLRGLAILEVHVSGPRQDLHSGSFGGGVLNPVNVLAKMIGSLHDADGRVTVPGFYDRVLALTEAERKEIASLPFDEKEWLASTGSPAAFGEKGYSTLERVWARPTLDCNGIAGGFQGEGSKTIIPARAMAKLTCRLVPDQDPEEIVRLLSQHLEKIAPPGVRVKIVPSHGGHPYLAPTNHPVFEVAKRAFAKAFGRPTVFIREGGSIPFVRTIADATGKPCLLMGFGQPDENAHAPNEWLDLENFHLGIKSAAHLYDELEALMAKKAKKSKKKQKKAAAAKRHERRFIAHPSTNRRLVLGLGALGALCLGAGLYAYTYGKSFAEDEKWKAIPSYLIAGGAVLMGITIWLGTSSDSPVRVGDPGIAVEKGETRRMPWWSVKQISFEPGSLALVITGKDEASRDWTFRVSLKSHPEAIGWIVSEAAARIPKRIDISDEMMDRLPNAVMHAGQVVELEPLQVVGRKCAVTGKTISYEPDARTCTRCERVYLRKSVPKKCKCGASLAHLHPEGNEASETEEDLDAERPASWDSDLKARSSKGLRADEQTDVEEEAEG